jgi:glycosyltransferase involved in cell wall biosynthesis
MDGPDDRSRLDGSSSAPALIAVVIVCRNVLPALRRTVESVLAHGESQLMLFIVDGASTDGSDAYLRSIEDRLSAWVSEPDDGIYDAMNKGWSMVPSDAYVLYLGAGDLLLSLPQRSALVDRLGCPYPIVIGRSQVGSMMFRSRWGREMWLRNTAHHQSLLIRKSIWPDPPFDVGLRVYGDWDFNLRLLKKGYRAVWVEELHAFAEPGGASWHHDLSEIRRVASRHGGPLLGWLSLALNQISAWRRKRRPTV